MVDKFNHWVFICSFEYIQLSMYLIFNLFYIINLISFIFQDQQRLIFYQGQIRLMQEMSQLQKILEDKSIKCQQLDPNTNTNQFDNASTSIKNTQKEITSVNANTNPSNTRKIGGIKKVNKQPPKIQTTTMKETIPIIKTHDLTKTHNLLAHQQNNQINIPIKIINCQNVINQENQINEDNQEQNQNKHPFRSDYSYGNQSSSSSYQSPQQTKNTNPSDQNTLINQENRRSQSNSSQFTGQVVKSNPKRSFCSSSQMYSLSSGSYSHNSASSDLNKNKILRFLLNEQDPNKGNKESQQKVYMKSQKLYQIEEQTPLIRKQQQEYRANNYFQYPSKVYTQPKHEQQQATLKQLSYDGNKATNDLKLKIQQHTQEEDKMIHVDKNRHTTLSAAINLNKRLGLGHNNQRNLFINSQNRIVNKLESESQKSPSQVNKDSKKVIELEYEVKEVKHSLMQVNNTLKQLISVLMEQKNKNKLLQEENKRLKSQQNINYSSTNQQIKENAEQKLINNQSQEKQIVQVDKQEESLKKFIFQDNQEEQDKRQDQFSMSWRVSSDGSLLINNQKNELPIDQNSLKDNTANYNEPDLSKVKCEGTQLNSPSFILAPNEDGQQNQQQNQIQTQIQQHQQQLLDLQQKNINQKLTKQHQKTIMVKNMKNPDNQIKTKTNYQNDRIVSQNNNKMTTFQQNQQIDSKRLIQPKRRRVQQSDNPSIIGCFSKVKQVFIKNKKTQ